MKEKYDFHNRDIFSEGNEDIAQAIGFEIFDDFYSSQNLAFVPDSKKITISFLKAELKLHSGINNLKHFLVVCYLRKHTTVMGEINTNMKMLIKGCGYSTTTKNSLMMDSFKNILLELIDRDFISSESDIVKLKPTEVFTINLSKSKNIFGVTKDFVLTSVHDFDTIVQSKTKSNKAIIMGVYLSIKQYIYHNSVVDTGRVAFPSKSTICKNVGVSLDTVEKAIEDLVELRLLYKRTGLYIQKNNEDNILIPARNIFALEKEHLYTPGCLDELSKSYDGKKIYTKETMEPDMKISYL